MQVNALAEVLFDGQTASRTAAPILMSSKSHYGHAEPAAGVVSLLHVISSTCHAALPSVGHLRTLNPLINNSVKAGMERLPGTRWGMMRQPGPWPSVGSIGISGFAYQVRLQ